MNQQLLFVVAGADFVTVEQVGVVPLVTDIHTDFPGLSFAGSV